MEKSALGSSRSSISNQRNGITGRGIRAVIFSFTISVFVLLFFTFSHLFTSPKTPSNLNTDFSEVGSIGRSTLALKSDPRLDQIRKQADDHRTLALAYASYARKLKLENAKLVRVFAHLSREYTDLITKLSDHHLFDSNGNVIIDESVVKKFESEVKARIKAQRQVIADAKESFDFQLKIQKLKDMIFALNELLAKVKKQGAFSSLIAAKSIPKSLHCLSMSLMNERSSHPDKYSDDNKDTPPEFEDPKLYHYAIFSDNVIAASVVVNSAVNHSIEPTNHVFHVVTDQMNLGAMQVMFKTKDYRGAHIEVKSLEDYKFLNSSYVPVLKQIESANLQSFYFGNQPNATNDASNMKFRNPKYLSMLNHVRFYLPQMYPKLDRILFLDDDVVVQKDLTGLWDINMDGKVNGAVETCFGSFHRYSQYMNFSHPLIKERFNPKACAWAYGMNFFDLDAWRRENCTEEYHYWQNLNENRTLWKLGTLPPGLITFYSTTKPLNKTWHVLGLGYNPSISMDEIKNAAVVHFNGNMKPWLDIAMNQYRPLWTKYVDYDNEFVQACNFGF